MKFRVRFGAWSDAFEEVTATSARDAIRVHARVCKALHTGECIEACAVDANGVRYEKIVTIDHQGRVVY